MLHLLNRLQHGEDRGTGNAEAPKGQQNSNVGNPIVTTPCIVGHDDCSATLSSDEVIQQALVHAYFDWAHALAAA